MDPAATQFYIERFSAIFIFTLIISGNFLAQLFPCKIQEALNQNIYLKHFFGFMTLFFFGIVAIPSLANISGMISSLILYVIFLINAKTKYQFWIAVFMLYALIYLLHIVKKEYDSYIVNEETSDDDKKMYESRNVYIDTTQNLSMGLIVFLTVIGFLTYMGEKKLEYSKKFDYHTFFLGKPSCRDSNPKNVSMVQSLKAVFN